MGYQIQTDFSSIEPSMGGQRNYFPASDAKGWLGYITLTEATETAKKDGMTLHIVVTGNEGPVMGKTHDHYVNIVNPNAETMRYAQQELSAIGHVLGHIRVGNTDEWLNKPLRVVIGLDLKNQDQYPGSTRVNGWRDVNGNKPKEAGPGAGQTTQGQGGGQNWNPAGNVQGGQPGGFVANPNPNPNPAGGQPGGPGWNGQGNGNPGGGFNGQPTQGQGFNPAGGPGGPGGQPGGFDPNANPNPNNVGQGFNPNNMQQPNNNQGPQGGPGGWNGGGNGNPNNGAPGWTGNQ